MGITLGIPPHGTHVVLSERIHSYLTRFWTENRYSSYTGTNVGASLPWPLAHDTCDVTSSSWFQCKKKGDIMVAMALFV